MPIKPQKIVTEADLLMNLVRDVKEISMEEAAKTIGVPIQTVEQWATLLEEERIIAIKYKFTTPYLTANEEKTKTARATPAPLQNNKVQDLVGQIDELLTKVEAATKTGEFGVLKSTLPNLILNTKSFKDSVQLPSVQISEFDKKIAELETNLQRANMRLSAGNFDVAHAMYTQIYQELKTVLDKIKVLLRETEKQAEHGDSDFRTLTEKAYFCIQAGQLENASGLYQQLKAKYQALPAEFLEKKTDVEKNLAKLNKDLSEAVDQKAIQLMREGVTQIKSLIAKCNMAISKSDFAAAEEAYYQIKKKFEIFPSGFATERKKIEKETLEIFEKINTKKKRILEQTLKEATGKIKQSITTINKELKNRQADEAMAAYEQAKAAYERIPNDYLAAKMQARLALLPLYGAISQLYTETLTEKFNTSAAKIKSSFELMKRQADSAQIQQAGATYASIKEQIASLPSGFAEEKVALQNQLIETYQYILAKSEDYTTQQISGQVAAIQKMADETNNYLKNGQYDLAQEMYTQIANAYNHVPAGHTNEKIALRHKIIDIYRELILKKDERFLQSSSTETNTRYHEILKLLVMSRHDIENRQFRELEEIYRQIRQILEKLPLGFINQNTKLTSNVMMLGAQVLAIKKLKEAEQLPTETALSELKTIASRIRLPEFKPLTDYLDMQIQELSKKLPKQAGLTANTSAPAVYAQIATLKSMAAPQVRPLHK